MVHDTHKRARSVGMEGSATHQPRKLSNLIPSNSDQTCGSFYGAYKQFVSLTEWKGGKGYFKVPVKGLEQISDMMLCSF